MSPLSDVSESLPQFSPVNRAVKNQSLSQPRSKPARSLYCASASERALVEHELRQSPWLRVSFLRVVATRLSIPANPAITHGPSPPCGRDAHLPLSQPLGELLLALSLLRPWLFSLPRRSIASSNGPWSRPVRPTLRPLIGRRLLHRI